MWIWVGILFFVSTMSMNSYKFFETVGIIIITLFACVFMWVVFAMIFMLGNEVVSFFKGIIENWQVYFSMQGGNAYRSVSSRCRFSPTPRPTPRRILLPRL